MIYAPLGSKEITNMQHTARMLRPLECLVCGLRKSMHEVAMSLTEKSLQKNILSFVAETGPCENLIKNYTTSIKQIFPEADESAEENHGEGGYTDPFDCLEFFEFKIVKGFRNIINDYRVLEDIRSSLRMELNEMLYAFLKVKMLKDFNRKELVSTIPELL